MAHTVFCKKNQQQMDGLNSPPFPGPAGEDIFNNVSQQAWQDWLVHQTMLINEKRLNMMDLTARTYLAEQRDKFLSGENFDTAEGYVVPTE